VSKFYLFVLTDMSCLLCLGYRVGQVRCVFTLPVQAICAWFHSTKPSFTHLAYIDWFTPFSPFPYNSNHQLYKVSRLRGQGEQVASVVPLHLIKQSVHLTPVFGPVAPIDWKSSNVLDLARYFHVNPFSDRFSYSTLY
jgi:hypothetical protein